ncbi:hypothetical protein NIES4073_28420 [Kalymmatonema gypsitolerans NIES-4073]|nr:hypothetical protein NIES4073_28420 [Scytonema sp. NIES-4073]
MSYLEISLIRSDRTTQPRAYLNLKLIGEYAEAMASGERFRQTGRGHWLVGDGAKSLLT